MHSSKKIYPTHPASKEQTLVFETGSDPQISVIWLHGLGDTNVSFSQFFKNIPLYKTSSVRFIAPQAPTCPVTVQSNMSMTSWYDILNINVNDGERQINFKDLQKSVQFATSLIQMELESGIQPRGIFLGGFSQGGAVSLETMFSLPQKIGGYINLSGYLPYKESQEIENKKKQNIENRSPVFFSYGSRDLILPVEMFTRSSSILQKCEFSLSTHVYDMDHETCAQQILDVNEFLIKKGTT